MPETKTTTADELVQDQRNANKHTEHGTLLLEKGLRQNGLGRSILISNDNVIIAGNGVHGKATELGIKKVKIVETTGDEIIAVKRTDIESNTKEFFNMALSDNIIAQENISMDAEVSQAIGQEYQIDGDWIVETDNQTKARQDDYTPPDLEQVKTDIKEGDIFQIGNHVLICGDSRDQATWDRLMNGEQADLVLTDPPYNVDYQGSDGKKIMNDKMNGEQFYLFLFRAFSCMASVTREGGAWYIWHADSEGLNFRKAFVDAGILLKQNLIWVKNSLVMGRQDYQWKHEPCLYGWKPGAAHYFTNSRSQTTVIEDVADYSKMSKKELLALVEKIMGDTTASTVIHHAKPSKNDLHPTMKPILLMAQLMENSSTPGAIVVDGFGGSGSTMITSEQLQRKCRMMELDPRYCQVIVDRMINFDPKIKIKKNGRKYTPQPAK